MFPLKSPLEQILSKNYDGIEAYSETGQRLRVTKYLGNRFWIELNGDEIVVSGEQLFEAITSVFKSLTPENK